MMGIVVVCHSRELATAAVAFATRVAGDDAPTVLVAAGVADGALGTDAAAITKAIVAANSGDGVLVFLDLGSALMSAELAVEFLPASFDAEVRITSAPLVEGLVAAVAAASAGASLEEADAAARRAVETKRSHVDDNVPAPPLLTTPAPTPKDTSLVWRATVRNARGLHLRPAATVVTALGDIAAEVLLSNATTGAGPARATSLSRVTALQVGRGQVLQARISGPEAEEARRVLADLSARDFGESASRRQAPVTGVAPAGTPAEAMGPSDTLPVVGQVILRSSGPPLQGYVPGTPKDELDRFFAAVAQVKEFLADLAAGGDPTGIVAAEATLLTDRALNHEIVTRITEGFSAVESVGSELTRAVREFEALSDPFLRERAQDLRGLRRLLHLALMERPLVDEGPDEPRVWVVDELDAPTALRLDRRTCLGVITTSGGATGHGVLTARGRGIAVLPGRRDAATLRDGDQVAFDPVTGDLWRRPSPARRSLLAEVRVHRRRTAQRALARAHEDAVTTDGVRVPVLANVSTLADARESERFGADGVGLLRSEILFSSRVDAPSAEEQAAAYVEIARALGGRPVTIRTWDAGADKPLAFVPTGTPDNPAMALRGIRAMRLAEDVFAEQLRAVLLAARDADVRVMFPMVSSADDVTWARGVLDAVQRELGAGPVPVGIMVEVPVVALRAGDFAGIVDFASVGTNDLAQYAGAADRTDPDVGGLARQDDPAVLELIRLTCVGLPGVDVAVCGDLAGDTTQTATLLRLGVAELSASPTRIPEVKQAVRGVHRGELA
ncbi:putative PEP-binding protein [Propioniciclava soli]|uniref:putative PEP-binding protein n=1 Tax=Propioniciclava soli TaxID=2775081 RepID=UPI001E41D62D|nr:putative PEP-binding protein [Propioniciclava soli]